MPTDARDDTRSHVVDATMFWNPTGGVRRYVSAKREWLLRQPGWRHSVAMPTPGPGDADAIVVPSAPLPGSGGAYRVPWQRRACAALLRDARPDLIEAADPYRLAWAALDAGQALGVPVVAFCHSNLGRLGALVGGRPGRAAAERYLARLYRHFDLVLAPSRAMAGHLRDAGVDGAEHQPLGVDIEAFHPRHRHLDLRTRLGLSGDVRLLVFAGRFAPEKRLQTLADAVHRLGDRYRLVVVGSGPAQPRGDGVVVLPAIGDTATLAAVLGGCDAFVHAGDQETFGLSVLEAMACGLPAVVRDAEGLPELVDQPGLGRRVRAGGGAADFAEAIDDLFAADLAALGAAARRRAEAQSWDRVLPPLAERYRRLLRRRDLAPRPAAREVPA